MLVLVDKITAVGGSRAYLADSFCLLTVFRYIVIIAFKQIIIRISASAEKSQSGILCLFDIAVCYYLSELLCRLVNAVSTAVRLHQSMINKVLVKEQCICRLAVKAREEHIDHDKQIDLRKIFLLQTLCNILAVRIKCCEVKARAEHSVIIVHTLLQISCGMLVLSFGEVFVRLKSEDSTNSVSLVVLLLESVIVVHKGLYLIHCEQCGIYIFFCRLDVSIKC